MRKGLKIIIGVVAGLIVIVGIWLAAPLFYDTRVSEDAPRVPDSSASLVSGNFEGADSFHNAAGEARVIESEGRRYVRFEDDFSVTNGPDLYVYLGKNGEYDADTNLGRLKGNVGSQNYEIPSDINVEDYDEVWVWCRAFSVPFGRAVLQ